MPTGGRRASKGQGPRGFLRGPQQGSGEGGSLGEPCGWLKVAGIRFRPVL